jgi:hypothetical protein
MLLGTWGFGSMNAKILAVGHLIFGYFARLLVKLKYDWVL